MLDFCLVDADIVDDSGGFEHELRFIVETFRPMTAARLCTFRK